MKLRLSSQRALLIACFLLFFSTLKAAFADDGIMHYVLPTQPLVMLDHSAFPPGGQIAVQYDAGDGWIPWYTSSLPYLPKSSGTLIDEITFAKPIPGTVNQLTSIYQRVDVPNSVASSMQPNSDGDVLQSGDVVEISQKEGDYFYVTGKGLSGAIPVSSVTVQPSDLATGTEVPVPPVPAPSATANKSPPRPGQLFAKLKVPYSLDGTPLAAGDYIIVAYDAGDHWVLGGKDWQSPPEISKAAVDLVSRVDFDTPLTGRITSPLTVYQYQPDVFQNPTTLEQSAIFSNLNPSVAVGDLVYIQAREGDDYVVQVPQQGSVARLGRVPVSDIELVTGDPSSGISTVIPPLPQSNNASAPGYEAPPPTPTSGSDVFWNYFGSIAAISVLIAIAGTVFRSSINASNLKAGEADYGVPHANFVRTDDGFRVTFSRSSESFYRVTHAWSKMQQSGGSPVAAIGFIIMMILLIFIVLVWYGIDCFFKTVVIVDRDSVKIGNKIMPRADFGSFVIDHSLTTDIGKVAVLGYQFGRRTFPFGGVWSDGQAQEVAGSLNSHLRQVPMAGDEHHPSPEALRETRPTDF